MKTKAWRLNGKYNMQKFYISKTSESNKNVKLLGNLYKFYLSDLKQNFEKKREKGQKWDRGRLQNELSFQLDLYTID